MPQRSRLLPYRVVPSFLSKAREVLGSETARVHDAYRWRGGRMASRGAGAAAAMPVVPILRRRWRAYLILVDPDIVPIAIPFNDDWKKRSCRPIR